MADTDVLQRAAERIEGRNTFTRLLMNFKELKVPPSFNAEQRWGFMDHARLYGRLDEVIQ